MKSNYLFAVMSVIAFLIVGGVACRHASSPTADADGRKIIYYTCPMHPSVRADRPGSCPVCGMNLVPVYAPESNTNNTATNQAAATALPACCTAGCATSTKP